MSEKTVTATQFKSDCLKLIDTMNRDREPVVVTRHGKPVAKLVPVEPAGKRQSIIGSMKGTVLSYGDIISPASDTEDWDALR